MNVSDDDEKATTINATSRSTAAAQTPDRSRRIYEEIFAVALSQSSSAASDSMAAVSPQHRAAEERYDFLLASGAATTISDCSAPTDEEEWMDRTLRQHGPLPLFTARVVENETSAIIHNVDLDETTDNSVSVTNPPISPSSAQAQSPPPPQSTFSDTGGGRLWRLAGEIAAAKKAALLEKTRAGPVGHLAESFLERMRSRADPNAPVAPPTPPRPTCKCPNFVHGFAASARPWGCQCLTFALWVLHSTDDTTYSSENDFFRSRGRRLLRGRGISNEYWLGT
jgi:hypothetical protein